MEVFISKEEFVVEGSQQADGDQTLDIQVDSISDPTSEMFRSFVQNHINAKSIHLSIYCPGEDYERLFEIVGEMDQVTDFSMFVEKVDYNQLREAILSNWYPKQPWTFSGQSKIYDLICEEYEEIKEGETY